MRVIMLLSKGCYRNKGSDLQKAPGSMPTATNINCSPSFLSYLAGGNCPGKNCTCSWGAESDNCSHSMAHCQREMEGKGWLWRWLLFSHCVSGVVSWRLLPEATTAHLLAVQKLIPYVKCALCTWPPRSPLVLAGLLHIKKLWLRHLPRLLRSTWQAT